MKTLRIADFIGGPLRAYADYDNRRSLPNLIDGLNMSQRKAIAAAIDMQAQGKVKVSSLAARAVEKFAYHHGESIMGTVVGLAQDYSGTNNINLMTPLGQFGNEMSKEHPAPRYIYTKLHDNFFEVFKKPDLSIVTPQYEDGDMIEPVFYIPTIPMILVNGADGTGFGFKSFILQHNPKDLKKAIKELITDENADIHLTPWLRGWTGKISKDATTRQVEYKGCLSVINKTTIHITEVPVKFDLTKFKELLNGLIDKETIKSYEDKSTDGKWLFEITCKRELVDTNTVDKLIQIFGLIQRETETVVCWGVDGKIRQFASTEDLLREWVKERLILADTSLKNQLKEYQVELDWLKIRMAFVEWCLGNIEFVTQFKAKATFMVKAQDITGCTAEEAEKLVGIRVYQLTQEEIEKMRKQTEDVEREVVQLSKKTATDWYLTSLV